MTDKEATNLFLFGGGCYYRDSHVRYAVIGQNELLNAYTLQEENGTRVISNVRAKDMHHLQFRRDRDDELG